VLLDRVQRRANRPLLKQGDPREVLERLIALRYPVYAEADIVVDSRDVPAERTTQDVLDALQIYLQSDAGIARFATAPLGATGRA
jgi:shikimate kinase